MASKAFSKTLRAPIARQLIAPRVAQRSYTVARSATRAVAAARPALAGLSQQQVRGVKTIDFAGVKEDVYGKCDIASARGSFMRWRGLS